MYGLEGILGRFKRIGGGILGVKRGSLTKGKGLKGIFCRDTRDKCRPFGAQLLQSVRLYKGS